MQSNIENIVLIINPWQMNQILELDNPQGVDMPFNK